MRYLVVSPDDRFADALDAAGDAALRVEHVQDAVGALGAMNRGDPDVVVLDAAADPQMAREFLAWWTASPVRTVLPLVVTGEALDRLPPGARRAIRTAQGVLTAIANDGVLTFDPQQLTIDGPRGVVRLTPSEGALVEYLVVAARPVPAIELLTDALAYGVDGPVGTVRTHMANVRRRLQDAGYEDVIETIPRRGYAVRGIRLREVS